VKSIPSEGGSGTYVYYKSEKKEKKTIVGVVRVGSNPHSKKKKWSCLEGTGKGPPFPSHQNGITKKEDGEWRTSPKKGGPSKKKEPTVAVWGT